MKLFDFILNEYIHNWRLQFQQTTFYKEVKTTRRIFHRKTWEHQNKAEEVVKTSPLQVLFTFPPSSFSFNIFHHNNILCRPCSIHYHSYFFIVANISSLHYSHGMPFQRFYIFSNLGMIQSSRAVCTRRTSSKIGRLPSWKNAVIIRLTQKN